MLKELCVVSIMPSEKSHELSCWLCGKDSEKVEIQKIFWIVNNEYSNQFLCNNETFYTKNTHRQPLKITWKSNSESTPYGSILFIVICPVKTAD